MIGAVRAGGPPLATVRHVPQLVLLPCEARYSPCGCRFRGAAQLGWRDRRQQWLAPSARLWQKINLRLQVGDTLELDVQRGAEALHLQVLLLNAGRELFEHRCVPAFPTPDLARSGSPTDS